MSKKMYRWKAAVLLVITLAWGLCATALAEGLSNDNSLSSLGILTEGAEVSPEFSYGTTEYDVTVPAGTQALELDPVPSNENAWIVDISGTELVDGETTVTITVSAESGEQYPYYLHVKASGDAAGTAVPAETETETETEKQTETEPETEDPRYVKVDRTALEEAENTINALKTETSSYRDRAGVLMKILYGMIAFCVVLLFVVINLLLKKKDLKAELNEYRGYGYPQNEAAEAGAGYAQGADGYDPGAPGAYDDGQAAGYADGYGQSAPGAYEDGQSAGYADGYGQSAPDAYEDGQAAGYADGYGQSAPDAYDDGHGADYAQAAAPTGEPDGGFHSKPASAAKRQAKKAALTDDPTTVPKPSRAKKKMKKMPEYEEPTGGYTYQQPNEQNKDKNVEVTMIDL